jgi:hypothetical protein
MLAFTFSPFFIVVEAIKFKATCKLNNGFDLTFMII